MRRFLLLLTLSASTLAFAGVTVSAPANGSSVSTTVQYVASASTTCAAGASAIGVFSTPGALAYSTSGSKLNTELTFAPGDYPTVVQEWDNCGGTSTTAVTIHVSGGATEVQVVTPQNNASTNTQVQYVATASTTCSKGVASMGVYTSPGVLAYTTQGASLNASLTLNPGTYHSVVQEWDACGGSAYTPVTVQVKGPSSGGQVTVSAPQTNTTVSQTVQYVASATTSCASGVASMGIYTKAGVLAYQTQGNQINTLLTLSPGTYQTVVQEWDKCGGSSVAPVPITVGGNGSNSGNTFTNLHQEAGWNGAGMLPPLYYPCTNCSPNITWSMTQGISSPSLSGNSSEMSIGGDELYSAGFWNNHLIGDY